MAIISKKIAHVWITSGDDCQSNSISDYSDYITSVQVIDTSSEKNRQKYLISTPVVTELKCGTSYTIFSKVTNYLIPNAYQSNINKDAGRCLPNIFERFVLYGLTEYYTDANGMYILTSTFKNGKPTYTKRDGSWKIFWDPDTKWNLVSTAFSSVDPPFLDEPLLNGSNEPTDGIG